MLYESETPPNKAKELASSSLPVAAVMARYIILMHWLGDEWKYAFAKEMKVHASFGVNLIAPNLPEDKAYNKGFPSIDLLKHYLRTEVSYKEKGFQKQNNNNLIFE